MKPYALAFFFAFTGMSCNVVFDIHEGIPQCAGIAAGTPLADTKPGDCRRRVCNAEGTAEEIPFDDDLPDDASPCTIEKCTDGVLSKDTLMEVPCYDGPANTENIGVCHGGMRACVNGQPSEECTGQVVPTLETCLEPGDEDCDGQTDEEGMGCKCEPNSTRSCYSGPMGTAGIGACHAGTQTCDIDGNGYGACMGQVLPQPDVCDPAEIDENCDGFTTCTGRAVIVKQFGAANSSAFLQAMAIDGDGNVILAGKTDGTIDFGGKTVDAGSFVVKLNAQASPLWVKSYTNESCFELYLTTTSTGNILLAGRSGGDGSPAPDIQFDNETINVLGNDDFGFVVALDGQTGNAKWSRGTTNGPAAIHDVASDPTGNVYVVGDYRNQVSFAGQTFSSTSSAFLMKFSPDGNALWSRTAGSALNATANSVGTDAQGNVQWFGNFTDVIDLGNGVEPFQGKTDLFSASYDSSNQYQQSATYGSTDADWGVMKIASSGIRWIGGTTNAAVDFGGGVLPHQDTSDAFMAAFGADGQHLFSASCTGANNQVIEKMTVDPQGRAVFWGLFENSMNCDGEQYTAQSPLDVFIRSIDADYSHRWTRQFHSQGGPINARAIGADSSGGVWVGGTFSGTVDFDIKTITATTSDIFLVRLTQ